MKLLRIPASLSALVFISLLAACGGGGGGGTTTPPVTNPGGGGATPTPGPTATPTPAQTSTPGPTPTPTSSAPVVQANGSTVTVADGPPVFVYGTDNWQTNGATSSDPGDGDVAGGFAAGNASTSFNGVQCNLGSEGMVTGKFHVHSFLGIIVNGTHYAIPDAIGMQTPTNDEPVSGFANACYIHTHAPSGIIHVEDPTLAQSFTSQPSQYNLQSVLDIWGQQSFANIAAAAASGFAGPVSIYVGTPCPNNTVGCANPQRVNGTGPDVVTSYTLQTAAPQNVLLGHHVAIWVVVGALPANGLPAIAFGIST
jgi:hypothetical protein